MSMVLQANTSADYKPHPEGIFPAVCVDVIDLGSEESVFQGIVRMTHKVKLVFETDQLTEDGKRCTVSRNFTASLHPKAKLAEVLGKWRGRPVAPGESIDLAALINSSATLVISQQQNMVGRTYATIDAISKPTKKLEPSRDYDPVATRQRIKEWKARQIAGVQPAPSPFSPPPKPAPLPLAHPKMEPPPEPDTQYDPDVGF